MPRAGASPARTLFGFADRFVVGYGWGCPALVLPQSLLLSPLQTANRSRPGTPSGCVVEIRVQIGAVKIALWNTWVDKRTRKGVLTGITARDLLVRLGRNQRATRACAGVGNHIGE